MLSGTRTVLILILLILETGLFPLGSDGALARTIEPTRRGHLLLIGGGEKPDPVMKKFVQLAGGPRASILIFPTASGEPDTGDYYRDLLSSRFDCRNLTVMDIRTPADASRMDNVEAILAAGGIFFSGGDQGRITAALLNTPSMDAIRIFFQRGGVIGGTSAGTACMSRLMLTGEGDPGVLERGNIKIAEGLGFFPGAIVDQHFVTRRRQNRLLSVVLENPNLVGIGIEEATAVWLKPDLQMTVMGEGWVFVYDAAEARITTRSYRGERDHSGALGVKLHVLQPGDGFDLKSRRAALTGR